MLVNGVWQENWQPIQNQDEKVVLFDKPRRFETGSLLMDLLASREPVALKRKRGDITCTWLTFVPGPVAR